jgi:hypothetical protein
MLERSLFFTVHIHPPPHSNPCALCFGGPASAWLVETPPFRFEILGLDWLKQL